MTFTVDRIEEGIAILENEAMARISVRISELPAETKEGSVLNFDGTFYTLDTDAETERRTMMLEMQNKLFKKSKKD